MCGSYLIQKRPEATVWPWVICDRWWITNNSLSRDRGLGVNISVSCLGRCKGFVTTCISATFTCHYTSHKHRKHEDGRNILNKCRHRCSKVVASDCWPFSSSLTRHNIWHMDMVENGDSWPFLHYTRATNPTDNMKSFAEKALCHAITLVWYYQFTVVLCQGASMCLHERSLL